MRRLAPLIAALLWVVLVVQAHAGGIAATLMPWTPHPSGLSTPVGKIPPSKAQAIVAATSTCSFTLSSAPSVGDVLIAECVSTGTLQSGWTQIDSWTTGFTGRQGASAYHFVVAGDGVGPWTPYTATGGGGSSSAVVAYDMTGLSDTVWANHFSACGRAVEASAFSDLSVGLTVTQPTTVVASAWVIATTATAVNGPTGITGLSGGDFVNATSIGVGAGGATGQLRIGTNPSTATATASYGSGGSAAGASLDLICLVNP